MSRDDVQYYDSIIYKDKHMPVSTMKTAVFTFWRTELCERVILMAHTVTSHILT